MSDFRKDLKKHQSLLTRVGMKGMSLFGVLDSFVPGFEALHELLHAHHQEKIDRFCKALLNELPSNDPEFQREFGKDEGIDFFDLVRAFLLDRDEEKSEYYARMTALIAGGYFDSDWRKHFVSALKSLEAKDLSLLRKCYLVQNFDLIAPEPLTSNSILTAAEVTSQSVNGPLVSMSLSRLRNFQLINNEGITKMGVEFIKTTHNRDELTPDILKDERVWQEGYVTFVTAKKTNDYQDSVIKALKARRIRVELLRADLFPITRNRLSPTKALVFSGSYKDLNHSYLERVSRYSSNYPHHCIKIGPSPASVNMQYKCSNDTSNPQIAADFIAKNYDFMLE